MQIDTAFRSAAGRLTTAALAALASLCMLGASSRAPLGAPCPGGNGDCASGFCDAGMGSGNTNKCVPRAGTGKPGDYCSQNAHCLEKRCVGHECEGKKPLGAPCPGGNGDCASGFCDAGTGSGGTQKCVPRAGTGKSGDYCSQDAHCQTLICRDDKTCAAKRPNGEGCISNAACLSGWCDTGRGSIALDPRPQGTLSCVPAAGTGKDGGYCTLSAHCISQSCVNRKCAQKAGVGQQCADNAGCLSGTCDLGHDYLCLPLPGQGDNGDFCTSNGHCASQTCIGKKCSVAPSNLGIGSFCAANENCKSGSCDLPNGPDNQRCVPAAGTGVDGNYCTNNGQCSSGSCSDSKCKPKGTGLPTGAACSSNAECKSNSCGKVLGWFGDGPSLDPQRCAPAPGQGRKGDFCADDANCGKGLACTGFDEGNGSYCSDGRKNGEGCMENSSCASGWCDTGRGSIVFDPRPEGTLTCVPKAGTGREGDFCALSGHCASNSCVDRKCEGKVGLGRACPGGNAQCLSGSCDAGMGSGNTNKCVPRAGTGERGKYCSQDGHCRPGKACVQSKCQ